MNLRTLKDFDCQQKTVLLRADLNVPVSDGGVQDDTRIQAVLPTLKHLLAQEAKVVVLTHFGRPKGEVVEDLRVDVIATALAEAVGREVKKLNDCVGAEVEVAVAAMNPGDVILLENTRFHPGEKKNDPEFVAQLAALGDVFVNDAFGAIHRAHASTAGLAEALPSCAGLLLEKEVTVLNELLASPGKPLCLVVGGAKIDTKIGILERFLPLADSFLIGGALANTFLVADGHEVGGSLYQADKLGIADEFLKEARALGKTVILPEDVMTATEVTPEAQATLCAVSGVTDEMKILDIGPKTTERFKEVIMESKTLIWNGPMGLYEFPAFSQGTKGVAEAMALSPAVSVVGGGDSIDAIKGLGLNLANYSHISTGGGAMLEFLEGRELPGLQALTN